MLSASPSDGSQHELEMLTELGNFNDDPKMSDDGTLEAIQIAWPTKFLGACNNFCRGINVCSHVFGSP